MVSIMGHETAWKCVYFYRYLLYPLTIQRIHNWIGILNIRGFEYSIQG